MKWTIRIKMSDGESVTRERETKEDAIKCAYESIENGFGGEILGRYFLYSKYSIVKIEVLET